jgi:predicted dehydrogenase
MAKKTYGLSHEVALRKIDPPQLPYRPRDPKSYRPKIGLIGCGGISQSHLQAYKSAGYDVAALCDCDSGRADARRKQFYRRAKIYADPLGLLKRDDIEIVDIATHPHERETLIPAALKAKKHVLSQKPFVVDLDFGQRLCDLADKMNVKLAVNQNGRWSPHVAYTRLAIQRGLIGDVLGAHLHCHWNHEWIAGTAFDNIHHNILYDYAIHWFDMINCFVPGKRATRVTASIRPAKAQKARPPLLGQCMIDFDDAQATLVFDGKVPIGMMDMMYIAGSRGAIDCRGRQINKHSLTIYTSKGYASPRLQGSWFRDGFHGTMAELLCSIEENRQPYNNARDNLKSLELCFAAVASADTGKPQTPGKVRKLPQTRG